MDIGSTGLLDVVILLFSAVFVVSLLWHLNISPVLGFFAAGALIGQHGLHLVKSSDIISMFAEFGVVFLLFLVGLELTFERIVAMRKYVFGFGTLQVLITGFIIWLAVYYFGMQSRMALIVGGGLAMSSTAVAVELLIEKGIQKTQVGRIVISILLLQDLAVVPLIVLTPMLASASAQSNLIIPVLYAIGKTFAALFSIFVVGRLFIRPLFDTITKMKSNEIFIATIFLIILLSSMVTEHFKLSMALGAFVSGLLIAETEHRHDVETAILPFKKLLLGLFFMTVGMSVDIKVLGSKIHIIAILSIALITLKATVIYCLSRLFGIKSTTSLNVGLTLSQSGEFAFLLFGIATNLKVIPESTSDLLTIVVAITMAMTPIYTRVGDWLVNAYEGRNKKKSKYDSIFENDDLSNHVVIIGMGGVGQVISDMLSVERLSHVIVDIDPTVCREARESNYPVYKGDASKLITLRSVGAGRAKICVITISNKVTVKKIISTLNDYFPEVTIILNLLDSGEIKHYTDFGAHFVVSGAGESGLQLGAMIMSFDGYNFQVISSIQSYMRSNNYGRIEVDAEDEARVS